MRRFVLAPCLLLATLPPAGAAPPRLRGPVAAPPVVAVCLNPKKDYHADYLSGRAVVIKANAGKKPRTMLKVDTNCIGIDGSVHIKLDAKGDCLVAGDALKLRRNGDYGWQTCQITRITPITGAK